MHSNVRERACTPTSDRECGITELWGSVPRAMQSRTDDIYTAERRGVATPGPSYCAVQPGGMGEFPLAGEVFHH
jgi:hypothetical protein